MLIEQGAQAVQFLLQSSPPIIEAAASTPPPPAAKKCDAHTCPWWPYSSSKDFKTNAGLILLIVFIAVICALALNAAFRFIFRHRRHGTGNRGLEQGQPKPTPSSGEAMAEEPQELVFTAGMKLAGAEAECAICLSEFVEGEGIRVMEKCNHGFHVQCIRKWLNSRSSCPTCRAICRTPASSAAGGVAGCSSGNGAHRDLESGGSERGPQSPLV